MKKENPFATVAGGIVQKPQPTPLNGFGISCRQPLSNRVDLPETI
jgi:hypothetical protein